MCRRVRLIREQYRASGCSGGARFLATLALAWPMIAINLSQTGLGATDVVMLAWLGPEVLAAGSLGYNLYFVSFIGGLGLISAISAMIAAERGRNRHAVREVRRLLFARACGAPWRFRYRSGSLCGMPETILVGLGQEPAIAAQAAEYLRYKQWALLPMLGFVALRFFLAGMERPFLALVVSLSGLAVNALANYALIFGNFGAPAMGAQRRRHRHDTDGELHVRDAHADRPARPAFQALRAVRAFLARRLAAFLRALAAGHADLGDDPFRGG